MQILPGQSSTLMHLVTELLVLFKKTALIITYLRLRHAFGNYPFKNCGRGSETIISHIANISRFAAVVSKFSNKRK
jgi:hypothetical protein